MWALVGHVGDQDLWEGKLVLITPYHSLLFPGLHLTNTDIRVSEDPVCGVSMILPMC